LFNITLMPTLRAEMIAARRMTKPWENARRCPEGHLFPRGCGRDSMVQ
jgi:hypothetical protein